MNLVWDESMIADVFRAIKRKSIKYGGSCIFAPISSTVGAKIYETKSERDKASALQYHANFYKLAPQVGDNFTIPCLDISHAKAYSDYGNHITKAYMVYGYLTQLVTVPRTLPQDKEDKLHDALCAIGIEHEDLFYKNVGYIGKRLVCIDFDCASCYWSN